MRISDWSSDVCSSDLHYRGCAARRCLGKGCDAHWTKFRGSVLCREYLFGGFPDAFERRACRFLTFLCLLRDRRAAFLCPLFEFEKTARPDRCVSGTVDVLGQYGRAVPTQPATIGGHEIGYFRRGGDRG